MAKPKSPLLSLDARGTIGDALTFQKRGRSTIVREKPIPKDPYSLKQAYQRWDYRDYAYLWTLLTDSEKQIYRTKASKYHITGFSQWMREKLNTLPDLAGRWHFDKVIGGVTPDSSKNTNHATVYGATLLDGTIDHALHFDGLDDYVNCGTDPTIILAEEWALELHVRYDDFDVIRGLWSGHIGSLIGCILHTEVYAALDFYTESTTLGYHHQHTPAGSLQAGKWHTIWITWSPTAKQTIIDKQTPLSVANPGTIPLFDTFRIGTEDQYGPSWHKGLIDEAIFYNKVPPLELIYRHSERRYPS